MHIVFWALCIYFSLGVLFSIAVRLFYREPMSVANWIMAWVLWPLSPIWEKLETIEI